MIAMFVAWSAKTSSPRDMLRKFSCTFIIGRLSDQNPETGNGKTAEEAKCIMIMLWMMLRYQ